MVNVKNLHAVESTYSAKWRGVILYEGTHSKTKHLRLVLLLLDSKGGKIPNRRTVILDKGWLKPIEPLDILVNKDWLLVNSSEVADLRPYPSGNMGSFWGRILEWFNL